MTTTTSLKLSDTLKAKINRIALGEGKTPHALMVETLERGVEQALLRQEFYNDGLAAYQEAMQLNRAFSGDDVKAYIVARIGGRPATRPTAVSLLPTTTAKK